MLRWCWSFRSIWINLSHFTEKSKYFLTILSSHSYFDHLYSGYLFECKENKQNPFRIFSIFIQICAILSTLEWFGSFLLGVEGWKKILLFQFHYLTNSFLIQTPSIIREKKKRNCLLIPLVWFFKWFTTLSSEF